MLNKKITLLARGESSAHIHKLDDANLVVIANSFGDEIQKYSSISNYLNKSNEIRLCCNGYITELDSYKNTNFFDKYNVTTLIRPYIENDPAVCINNTCHLKDEFLSDIHKQWMYQRGVSAPIEIFGENRMTKYEFMYPSTGIAALAYTVLNTANDGDHINIIGLDFYDNSNYLLSDKSTKDWGCDGYMQEITYKLIKNHPNIKFTMLTYATKYMEKFKSLPNLNLKQMVKPNKKIAFIIAGWHYPKLFFDQCAELTCPPGYEIETFVVSHRDIDLPNVYNEKQTLLKSIPKDNDLGAIDHALYKDKLTRKHVESLNFKILDVENKHGDYYYINQWMEYYDYTEYDYICYTHDDTAILNLDLISDIVLNKCNLYYHDNKPANNVDWLMIYNTNAPRTPVPRGSFAFFKKDFFSIITKFDMSNVSLDRTGMTDSFNNLSGTGDWNHIARNLNSNIKDNNISNRIVKLSGDYRFSKYMAEGERGVMTKIFSK